METKGAFKKAVSDWLEWFFKFSKEVISRENTPQFSHDLCLALIGVRRSGKTSMAIQIANDLGLRESTFYFNFEDPLFFPGTTVDAIDQLILAYEELTGKSPSLVILDEVHDVQGWEKWVRKAVDTGRYRVIITGSSSKLLSSEIATSISGRVIEHTLWPLSFKETLFFNHLKPRTTGVFLKELGKYFKWGGFPKVQLMEGDNNRTSLLKQYLRDIVLRDVVARHTLKDPHVLYQVVSYYLNNISCQSSYTALRKAFGISTELAAALTSYLNEAFLVFECHRYHKNIKVQTRDSKKIYVIDSGLRTISLLSEREDWGRLAENAVYLELKRREKQVYYFREKQEVDFVVTEFGKPVEAIQVCYSNLQSPKTFEREVNALLECLDALDLKKGIVLTEELEDQKLIDGKEIAFIPLYLWLLS